jgi:hypothetical protein
MAIEKNCKRAPPNQRNKPAQRTSASNHKNANVGIIEKKQRPNTLPKHEETM